MSDTLQTNIAQVAIFVDGTQIDDFENSLEEVVVDSTHFYPSMATVRVYDPELIWINGTQFALGAPLKIELGQPAAYDESPVMKVVFDGEIVALEPEFSAKGVHYLTVRGYDKLHRALHGTKSRTFVKQTDSGIINKVTGDHGITAKVDTTNLQHEYVIQNNQSDLDFLIDRAMRIGFRIVPRPGQVHFVAPGTTLGEVVLSLGESLRKLSLRMSAARQVGDFKAVGWDMKTKQALTATAKSTSANGWTQVDSIVQGKAASKKFGTSVVTSTHRVPFVQGDTQAIADMLVLDAEGQFVEGEGVALGEPALLAGTLIKVTDVGSPGSSSDGKYAGKYYVTSATHIYNRLGYETHFTLGGRLPDSMIHTNGAAKARPGLVDGVVVGMVTNLQDPENLGRVKVKYPWLTDPSGTELESDWIRVANPMAGATRGTMFMPEVNDEVLLAFEHGDPRRPFMVGALWNGKDKPPATNAEVHKNGKTEVRMIKTRIGHTIVLDDSDAKKSILIVDSTTKNLILIDSSKNLIRVESAGDVEVIAGANMKLDAKGNITMKAGGNISIEAGANLDATANANATVTANTMATFEGKTSVAVKGGVAEVSATGNTMVKGAIVMIN